MNKKPFHEVVAQKLIEQLKQGTAPWQTPWIPGSPNTLIPMNPITGKRYKGINAIQLMADKRTDNRWMTYKQAVSLDAQVRKGEKGTAIQYWKFTEVQNKTDEKGKPILDALGVPIKVEIRLERPRVFFATVFNAEQIDGLPPLIQKEPAWNAIDRAEQILKNSEAVIQHSENNKAFYRLATDTIHLPGKDQFLSADNYYATALHELAHWSGHSSRLDRDIRHPFGSVAYAKEELRAEITSMILGDELGIGHDPAQHTAYIGSWIKVLQDDPLELFRASADAEKIQSYVLSLEQKQVQKLNTEQTITADVAEDLVMKQNQQMDLKEFQTTPFKSEDFLSNPRTLDEGIAMLNAADLEHRMVLQGSNISSGAIATEKVWLDISFEQKDVAKQIAGTLPNGRKAIEWDKTTSRWFAHPGADLDKLKPWIINQKTEIASKQFAIQENMATEKIWLVVPYEQREAVKQLAGKLSDGSKAVEWDKAKKCWFANPGANLDKLKPWIAENNTERQQPALTPEQEFSDALKSLGCFVKGEHPIMDGKTHRIAVEGDKKGDEAGFYVGHLDGHPAGYVKNNRTGVEMKWKSKGYSLSPEEKMVLQANALTKIQARVDAHAESQEQAALRVSKQIESLIAVSIPTPYLQAKGIDSRPGVFTDKKALVTYIPAIDENGKIWTIQYIQEDGTKRFAKDSRKEGCFHALGGMNALETAPALVIGEGYATAASVSDALGYATVAAFDAGNLKSVALALHARFPEKPVIIIGDDDKHLETTQGINPGKTKAREAALAVGGYSLFPIFAPGEQSHNPKGFTDFNDLATKSVLGQEGVRRQVNSIIENIIQKVERKSHQLLHEKKSTIMHSI